MYLKKMAQFNACYANYKRMSTVSWSNNLFVSYLKLPNLKGPTADEVTENIDLSHKTCLITGGTSGIGAEMVRCLLERNCDVIMACRNPYAAQVLSKTVWNNSSNKLTTYDTNLASLASVKNASEEILKSERKIDIVILNAAVFGIPWTLTEDEFETIFQVNFLSQFYLLLNIQNILTSDARLVFMSSDSHRNLNWSLEETISPSPEMISLPKEKYTSIKAYNTSKLCGILAMHYLCNRWTKSGRSVFCAHPGSFVKTNICSNWWPYEILYSLMYPFSKNIAQAAATPLYCATSPNLQGYSDVYVKNCKPSDPSDLALDVHLAYRVIDLSKALLMERIGFTEDVEKNVSKVKFENQIEEHVPETTKDGISETVLST